MKKYTYILLSVFFLACEKDIRPDLGEPLNAIVVDAWLNDKDSVQHIVITRSQPYFENEFPTKIAGATVWLIDSEGERYDFVEGDSTYIWNGGNGEAIGKSGRFYQLFAQIAGVLYESYSGMGRAPEIDSINFIYQPSDAFITQDYYFAEFFARDFDGVGDAYWIKTWKNEQYLDLPSEINIAFDAGFTAGGAVDGLIFIQPIRTAINPFEQDEEDNFIPPYLVGDSVTVEIYSINLDTFNFLAQVIVQTNRAGGFAALFAQPLANVSTNIFSTDPSKEKVVGFFNVGAKTQAGVLLTQEIANNAQEVWELKNR